MEILIRDSLESGAKVGARVVKKIIKSNDRTVLGLATGDTPLRMYHELIQMKESGELSFQNCTTFNLDEIFRFVKGRQAFIFLLYDVQLILSC